jgi:hypothetical protein
MSRQIGKWNAGKQFSPGEHGTGANAADGARQPSPIKQVIAHVFVWPWQQVRINVFTFRALNEVSADNDWVSRSRRLRGYELPRKPLGQHFVIIVEKSHPLRSRM